MAIGEPFLHIVKLRFRRTVILLCYGVCFVVVDPYQREEALAVALADPQPSYAALLPPGSAG